MRPVILTIAGSDCSAGAGIQADLKAIEANGGHAVTVVTAVTAQDRRAVRHVERLSAVSVRSQLDAVFEDHDVVAVKTGMLVNQHVIGIVHDLLSRYRPSFVVCDPVIRATSGTELLDERGVEAFKQAMLGLATLVTPNAEEAGVLSGLEVHDVEQARRAGRTIRDAGARAVLVTGGHLLDEDATDVLVDTDGVRLFPGPRIDSADTHGTGCILASAIATNLAVGRSLSEAIESAKRFVAGVIRRGPSLEQGGGSVVSVRAVDAPEGIVKTRSRDVE